MKKDSEKESYESIETSSDVGFLRSAIRVYSERWDEARKDLEKCRAESNSFRTLMLRSTKPPDVDPIYYSQLPFVYKNASLDDICEWLEVFEKHLNFFSEQVRLKGTEQSIKDHIKAKADKAAAQVKAFREKPETDKKERELRTALNAADKLQEKMIASLMKVGLTREDALKSIKLMKGEK